MGRDPNKFMWSNVREVSVTSYLTIQGDGGSRLRNGAGPRMPSASWTRGLDFRSHWCASHSLYCGPLSTATNKLPHHLLNDYIRLHAFHVKCTPLC